MFVRKRRLLQQLEAEHVRPRAHQPHHEAGAAQAQQQVTSGDHGVTDMREEGAHHMHVAQVGTACGKQKILKHNFSNGETVIITASVL